VWRSPGRMARCTVGSELDRPWTRRSGFHSTTRSRSRLRQGVRVRDLRKREGRGAMRAAMRKRTLTMREVAEATGFAPATVSLALRNHHSIPLATRKRIAAAARRLGYKPNPLVAALMATLRNRRSVDRHTVLALVTSHTAREAWRGQRTFVEMVAGAEARSLEFGYRLEEFSLRSPGMHPARFTQMLRTRGIHGLLINPLPHDQKDLELDLTDFAVVGLGASVASPLIERVSNDHYQSALLTIAQCRALGYRRIGLVVSREMSERLEDRWLSAFHVEQQRSPPAHRVKPLMPERTTEIPGVLSGWIAREKPDVVVFGFFAASYQQLFSRSLGLVALSTYDAQGSLTGIFQDSPRVGAIAVEHLIARLQRNDFGPEETARLHLIGGVWAPGRTARGPGTRREIVDAAALR
jgi:transcriptional regulator with XRE-family HTH domain